jgi:hypothetical protein
VSERGRGDQARLLLSDVESRTLNYLLEEAFRVVEAPTFERCHRSLIVERVLWQVLVLPLYLAHQRLLRILA